MTVWSASHRSLRCARSSKSLGIQASRHQANAPLLVAFALVREASLHSQQPLGVLGAVWHHTAAHATTPRCLRASVQYPSSSPWRRCSPPGPSPLRTSARRSTAPVKAAPPVRSSAHSSGWRALLLASSRSRRRPGPSWPYRRTFRCTPRRPSPLLLCARSSSSSTARFGQIPANMSRSARRPRSRPRSRSRAASARSRPATRDGTRPRTR
mmetsp:Transcript_57019/g.184667  ORF Transcript_57019/g.184667 Transcript_57019/m.184667 type:complete len:211 (-) Transcript_57019:644-1276(-)